MNLYRPVKLEIKSLRHGDGFKIIDTENNEYQLATVLEFRPEYSDLPLDKIKEFVAFLVSLYNDSQKDINFKGKEQVIDYVCNIIDIANENLILKDEIIKQLNVLKTENKIMDFDENSIKIKEVRGKKYISGDILMPTKNTEMFASFTQTL